MVLCTGFLKMIGTASVALTGSTTGLSSRGLTTLSYVPPSASPTVMADITTNPSTSSTPAAPSPGIAATGTGARRSPRKEAMRVKSPLIYSHPMSSLENAPPIYLKLDALQPSGSFKDRGMATLCSTLQRQGARRLVSSSGGNAGLSAALCGRILGMPVQVIVPSTTKPLMLEKIRAQGAKVEVFGKNWNEADARARWVVEEGGREGGPEAVAYIPPYDHPLLWEGHSTLVDELVEGGREGGMEEAPAAIVASVGGGGWVVGVETEGAASFAAGLAAGEVVRLTEIQTVATSLGALEVTPRALEYARSGGRAGGRDGGQDKGPRLTLSEVVTDAEAVQACRAFLRDHRLLVEPACGAALALGYSPRLRKRLKAWSEAKGGRPVVIVVCGGSGITPEILVEMERGLGVGS
ncbi:hypothetical protein NSK_001821 [Nannochloropsis salina CCMP1776]|uniref:L-serine ammonia-lyase n=1 Tax=Nannochloropsis salina CCMP1776 TaxID=1027361 RepID=A0A4D9D9N8_9STRA|nr:hypothetical protein NSK_001821 [Nannochloropsis salina CCMP1776]|eukprot:TFJ86733.1 hypothetical protein NSK_001821 [Nannochloropsis salina CCMP1776]